MTWIDFVNSNYNSNGDFSLNDTNVLYKGTSIKNVVSTDTIISDEEYDAYSDEGNKFYIQLYYNSSEILTYTMDSPMTWGQCVGLADDDGDHIINYDEAVPGIYRFMVYEGKFGGIAYVIEVDDDGDTPMPDDMVKIGMTYHAYGM